MTIWIAGVFEVTMIQVLDAEFLARVCEAGAVDVAALDVESGISGGRHHETGRTTDIEPVGAPGDVLATAYARSWMYLLK